MGCCPCFAGFRGRTLRTANNIISSTYESRREPASNFSVGLRQEASVSEDGTAKATNTGSTFTYAELAVATNNFKSFLGRGGFGAVFKGKLKGNGLTVAVKQLDPYGIQGDKEFLVEVLMLSLMRHPNLVNLFGFCAEGPHRLLVYEYMPLGSLEDHLFDVTHDMEPLDWNTRMKIAAGAAEGLAYLHCSNPPVIYRDLKASNILLDESFHPKLSDFGLAKFGPMGDKSHVSTRVMGTYGYCAPEYALTGRLTMKTDIYSFGIVLLELITGGRAVEEVNGHQKHLLNWALPLTKDRSNYSRLADPWLRGQFSMSVLKKTLDLTLMCLNENAKARPTSSDLMTAMEYLASYKYEPKETKKVNAKWPEIDLSPSDTTMIMDKELDRDRAVAEAKTWGESWREKRLQRPETQSIPDSQR